jgi:hypothetical protein
MFIRLEFAGLFYIQRFAGERPGDTSLISGRLPLSITAEWDWHVGGIPPQKPAAHSTAARRLPWRKMAPALNIWTANSPTHINQYLSVLT